MSADKYKLLLTGEVLPGWRRDLAVLGLRRLLKLPEQRADQLLRGSPSRLKTHYTRTQAEQAQARLISVGVECRIEPVATGMRLNPLIESLPAEDRERAEAAIGIAARRMRCPKCGHEQTAGPICAQCGIAVEKYRPDGAQPQRPPARQPAATARAHRLGLLERLFQLTLLLSLAMAGLAYVNKDRLPAADFYTDPPLGEPLQVPTDRAPFSVDSNGIRYRVTPQFDYQLNGVVVSYHDSDAWWDIYHHLSWKDFINIKDLCVIWGDNLDSEVYREMRFENTTWTCWAYWPSREVGRRFSMRQLSNNHLLADNREVQHAIMAAQPGDQVRIQGMLASYSHGNGAFERGTSTSRTDTGNGACETIFVEDFSILQTANRGWRLVYAIALATVWISLIGVVVMLFVAPQRSRVRGY